MKIQRVIEDDVSILICENCNYTYWIQTLFGPKRQIANQIPTYCPNCGSASVRKATIKESETFMEIGEDYK